MTSADGAPDARGQRHIRCEVRDGVGIVTLDRPHKRNAMTADMYADFNAATHRCEHDDSVGALMIVGTGSAFCAGGDLDLIRAANAGLANAEGIDLDLLDPASISKPIISAIVGPCVGEGVAIALASDLVIAGTSARFALPEVSLGVPPVDIPLLAAGRVNPIHILDALLTGDWKDAAWAERVGLVNSVCPDDEVWATAFHLACRIAAAPRSAATLVKSLVHGWRSSPDRAQLRQRGAAARKRIRDSLIADARATQS